MKEKTYAEIQQHRVECWDRFTAAVRAYRTRDLGTPAQRKAKTATCKAYRAAIKAASGEEVAARAEREVIACAEAVPRDNAQAKQWASVGLR